jgi:hypothetical protein
MKKNKPSVYLTVIAILLVVLVLISVFADPNFWKDLLEPRKEPDSTQEVGTGPPEDVVGVEVYDLSLYEESSEEYVAALAQMEDDWFPRNAVVIPKGPEGGDLTWIGDIAVGTEVVLEGVVDQGEWCFVTGETIGGWSSSGWVWCYRLFIPE